MPQEQVVVLLQKIKQTMKAARFIQLGLLIVILSTKLNAQSTSIEKVGFLKKQLQEHVFFKNRKGNFLKKYPLSIFEPTI
ncbi:MAG: hypothetical protein IPH89_09175 [Bacteroidetes bacterium]|nr:hypothetical protein [Bacteroidota bacterium]